jgi:hypothetical protein
MFYPRKLILAFTNRYRVRTIIQSLDCKIVGPFARLFIDQTAWVLGHNVVGGGRERVNGEIGFCTPAVAVWDLEEEVGWGTAGGILIVLGWAFGEESILDLVFLEYDLMLCYLDTKFYGSSRWLFREDADDNPTISATFRIVDMFSIDFYGWVCIVIACFGIYSCLCLCNNIIIFIQWWCHFCI